MNHRNQSGQTLVELIVAIGVVAIVLIALVSSVTASLRYAQQSRNRSTSVKLAQEAIELTRKLRDTSGWDVLATYASPGGSYWCLDAAGAFTESSQEGACPVSVGSNFWRKVTYTYSDPILTMDVSVSWGERTSQSTVSLRTYFTEWK